MKSRGGGGKGFDDPITELKNAIITSTENPNEYNNPVPGYIVQLTSLKNGNGYRDIRYNLNGNLNPKFQNELIKEAWMAEELGHSPQEGEFYKLNEALEKQFKTDKLMSLFVSNQKEFIEEIKKY